MPELGSDPQSWVLVAGSIGAALALPAVASWRLTPAVLREHFLLSKPGRVVATSVLLLLVLGVTGTLVALAAIVHPFLWATEALVLSELAVVLVYLVRYRAAARAFSERIGEPDRHRRESDER